MRLVLLGRQGVVLFLLFLFLLVPWFFLRHFLQQKQSLQLRLLSLLFSTALLPPPLLCCSGAFLRMLPRRSRVFPLCAVFFRAPPPPGISACCIFAPLPFSALTMNSQARLRLLPSAFLFLFSGVLPRLLSGNVF